jgi:AmmeMemoRadiSam system protein A
MAPLFSIELSETHQGALLDIARDAIEYAATGGLPPGPRSDTTDEPLQARVGTFVTLTIRRQLRGCIGSLQGSDPLCHAVADAAYSAARRDPRFAPLRAAELPATRIEISVLSQPEGLEVASRAHLLSALRPGVDGLVLEDGRHRSTFLPKVWEQLPRPEQFLAQLLAKAGLPPDHWSDTLRFNRYQAISFGETVLQQ